MSRLTAMSIILGGVLPGSVLVCQSLYYRAALRLTDEMSRPELWMPIPIDTTVTINAIVTAALTISSLLWILSACHQNQHER